MIPRARMTGRVEVQPIREMFAAARATRRPLVSVEFFPPKDEQGERTLLEKTLPALRELQPDFCSVTCGDLRNGSGRKAR
jgi:5,10-methylenetetrahydrofolate reductase